jgi:hypothetical protein
MKAGIPSQGECTVNVESHGEGSSSLEPARLTVDKALSKPNGIVVTPPLLKKLGGLGVGLLLEKWTSWEPSVGTLIG